MQGEVLEELRHNYPLDLLMALSDAAIGALKVLISLLIDQSGSVGKIRKGTVPHSIHIIRSTLGGCGAAYVSDIMHTPKVAFNFLNVGIQKSRAV